ncbi:MAG: dipeptide ABC transporter ATP-binding protein [Burkholderiaceae bacterium]
MLLSVENLEVCFATRRGTVQAVRSASFEIKRGETIGIVGESGSGKSVSSYAILQILDKGGAITGGQIHFDGTELSKSSEQALREIRGRDIAMVFQNPRSALNPIRKIGQQIEDVQRRHARSAGDQAHDAAVEMLRAVRIANPERRYHAYPFELSGGMCQRVLIAIALACNPRLLIADEPTTGLDVTTQKVIMDLIAELTHERQMASLLITHDLGLAAQYCDRIVVMKDGEVVETGLPADLFSNPSHAYTRRLIRSTPRAGASARDLLDAPSAEPVRPAIGGPLLVVDRLRKVFGQGENSVRAVDDVSFVINEGETLGLVGESGSGKSTVSAMICRLSDPTGGAITLAGESLLDVPAARFARDPRRASIQMVFQDATDSLNPRFTVRDAIADPIRRLTDEEPESRVPELAAQVGLPASLLDRLPHQLSGGQKARVGIARALASRPRLLVLDEPTAALDVSIQATVLNLLVDLRAELGISYLFVSHDLQVVRLLCDQVIVMQAGKIVESGKTTAIMAAPTTDYTKSLLAAAPVFGQQSISGQT